MIKKILIIDDDDDEMDILSIAFRQIEMEVDLHHEKNPENAIEVLKRFRPNILFLDYNMPKMNGLVCLNEIRKVELPEPVLIILYSSHITEEVQKKAMELGAIGCIEKAYSVNALVRKINKLLKVKDPI
jgi:DNA-binding response OmpR family regulator